MSWISRGEILVIGRYRTLSLTRTSTTRTSPSGPGQVCSMRPTFHSRLAALGSITTTTSPTWMLSAGKNHFGLDPICGKYSRIQRWQTCLVNSCTLRQCFLGLKGVLSTPSTSHPWRVNALRANHLEARKKPFWWRFRLLFGNFSDVYFAFCSYRSLTGMLVQGSHPASISFHDRLSIICRFNGKSGISCFQGTATSYLSLSLTLLTASRSSRVSCLIASSCQFSSNC